MTIEFKIYNKTGAAIIPDIISFRLEETFMDHASLVFRTAESAILKNMSKVEVRDGTTPLFMGYIYKPEKVASPDEPSNFYCYSVSKLLEYRYPPSMTFESGTMIKEVINDAIGTTGVLADANHRLNFDMWLGPNAPNYTWYIRNHGTNRFVAPSTMYIGATPITHATSLAAIGVNQWWQTATEMYVRTSSIIPPDNSPYCYWQDYKSTSIKRMVGLDDTGLNDRVYTFRDESIYSFLARLFKANHLEYEYQPNNDGFTYLRFAQNIANGSSVAPVITFTKDSNVIRIKFTTLDHDKYGFNAYSVECKTFTHSDISSVHNASTDLYFWRDSYTKSPTLTSAQASAASLTEYGKKWYQCYGGYEGLPVEVTMKYASSPALVCGDWVWLVAAIGRTYRILSKITELADGKLTATMTLHDWYNF